MENLSKYPPIFFEDGFYSIPEAIEKISTTFNISFDDNVGKSNRKTIYTRLSRELKQMNLASPKDIQQESPRKTKYSHIIWNAIFREQYDWLCQIAGNMDYKQFEEWKKRKMDYGRKYGKILATADQTDMVEPSSFSSEAKDIEEQFQKRRLEIALDFIFSNLIKLDETKLRMDIENTFWPDEADPSIHDLIAVERLMNLKSYYTIRENK